MAKPESASKEKATHSTSVADKGEAIKSNDKTETTEVKEGAESNFSPPNLRKKTSTNPQLGGTIKDK